MIHPVLLTMFRRSAATLLFLLIATVARAQPASAPSVQPGPPTPVTVTVDFSALSPEVADRIDALGLESRVINRLIEEGFAVVASFAAPDVHVRAEEVSGTLRLTATGAGTEESVNVVLGTGTRAELQLEIAQKSVDLSRSRVAAVQTARAKAQHPPPRPLQPRPWEPDAPTPPQPRAVTVDLALGAAALWRGPTTDPLAELSVGVDATTLTGLFGFGATFGVSRSVAPDLLVTEWQLTVGPNFHLLRAGSWFGDAAVELGVISHEYTYKGIDALNPVGESPDGLALIPFTVGYRLTDFFEASVRIAPGLATREHDHLRDGDVIWHREAARLQAGAQVGFRF